MNPSRLAVLLLLLSTCCYAQQPKYSPAYVQDSPTTKIKLFVAANGSDMVGQTFVFELREAISRSATYEITDSKSDALVLDIISIDPMTIAEFENRTSAVSIIMKDVAPTGGIVLSHRLLIVGNGRTKDMAQTLLASLDADRVEVAKIYAEMFAVVKDMATKKKEKENQK